MLFSIALSVVTLSDTPLLFSLGENIDSLFHSRAGHELESGYLDF